MADVHSWVGIIMYLPTDDATQRTDITEAFFNYKKECAGSLWGRYGAQEHWAKIEVRHPCIHAPPTPIKAKPLILQWNLIILCTLPTLRFPPPPPPPPPPSTQPPDFRPPP